MSVSDPNILMTQAFALVKQGRMTDADSLFSQLCEQDEKNGRAWFMRGAIQFERGNANSALAYLNTAIEHDPGISEAHFTLCKIYLSRGNLVQAIAHVKRVVALEPERGEAWLALGSFYADAGQFQQAEKASRTAIALLPSVVEAKINLVNALISQKKEDEALTLCKSIKVDNLINPGIWHSLGLAFKALGLADDAEQCFIKVTKLDPTNAAAFCTLGELKAAQDEIAQALLLYEKAKELAPAYPLVYFEIAKVLLPNSSAKHRQLVKQLEQDYQYSDINEAKNIASDLAIDFLYGDTIVERALIQFFDKYDPSCLYPGEWWMKALQQFGERRQGNDTALRSIYSTVFSWSLPCREALDEIAVFSGKRIASYGSGAGYWEYLLATHYNFDVVCHDMKLRHRFTSMKQLLHSDATVDPEDTIFLAWLPGEATTDTAIESLLDQTRAGQKLILVGEPADDNGQPRTCGTQRFFQYLRYNYETQGIIPLPNYAYFKDRVELLVKK